ncbi:filamentous haemagglutinin family protein [Methylomagnum sp.]
MTHQQRLFPAAKASPPSPLALAIRSLCAGGLCLSAAAARAELPVPAQVLVAPGTGNVLPPSISGNIMTIKQLSDKATLDWQSFNIGRENTVKFEQPSSTAVALNRIHQADPSRIYGTLTANGQVYLVNQNGFVFGKDSQINVNSLVATTLNISEKTFQLGLTLAFDQNKQAALEATDANGNAVKQLYLKDASGQPVLDQNGQKVKIQIFIEPGAKLKTNGRDGRVILAAPSITNQGSIETPDGQAILAASQDKVYLQQAGSDSDIRGLLVEVGTGGDVSNVGKIIAERGNASLLGFAVNQKGLVSATTSVKLNGSVRLLAREGIQDPLATGGALRPASTKRGQDLGDGLGQSADVKLEKGSVTSVELDANKAETAVDAQAQTKSSVAIAGHKVFLNDGATVRAKSGAVQIAAADDLVNANVRGDSRIYLDKGSRIDVSGVKNVSLPMARNVVKVELRSNELRDSPLQRDGVLHGQTVSVDVRKIGADGRIPIADVSGALDRIARNIDERSTAGGRIALNSTGSVITRKGSVLDFSGGSVAYRSGYIETTQLVSKNQVYDIAEADPNRHYDSILGDIVRGHPKWNLTERWSLPGLGLKRFEPGYMEGKAGGAVDIAAFEAELDGLLQGQTVAGPRQREASQQAAGSTLSIDLNRGNLLGEQDVVFGKHSASGTGPNDPFPTQGTDSAETAPLAIDPALFKHSGIAHVDIKTNGALRIEKAARVTLPENGGLRLAAAGFEVQGVIAAPSGDVGLTPVTFPVDGKPVALPSAITLGGNAAILAGGQWTNDVHAKGNTATVALDGGHVSLLTEQGDLTLAPGSRIDVSGGAWLQSDGTLKAGHGGSIQLTAATKLIGAAPSNLSLGGRLSGWGLNQGGGLALTSNEVFIGPSDEAPEPDPATPDHEPLVLAPAFFRQGGFADYSIGANFKGVTVADGAQVRPLQQNRILVANAATQPSAAGILNISQAATLADTVRQPANLRLSMAQLTGQDRTAAVSVGTDAVIETDPTGHIALSSDTSVLVDGTLKALAGRIDLTIATPGAVDTGYFAAQGIWLGSDAKLLAAGVFDRRPDGTGLVTGEVLPGGAVNLTANRGYIVAAAGSVIDISGTAATLQFREPAGSGPGLSIITRSIPSAGGSLSLTAGEGVIADGSFKAASGGKGVGGGEFSAELNGLLRAKPSDPIPGGAFPDDGNPQFPRAVIVSDSADPVAPEGLEFGVAIATDQFAGRAFLNADQLNAGGFRAVALRTDAFITTDYVGRIEFRGDVSLNAGREIRLDAPTLAWSRLAPADTGVVDINAPRVALGSTQSRIDIRQASGDFSSTLAPDAKTGAGKLNVMAQGIDLVGGLSFDGYGQATLDSAGDVRAAGIRTASDTKNYLGELKIAGNLDITASQFYPVTLTDYVLTASGPDASISLAGNGADPGKLYSAGGSLTLNAPNIKQGGVLRAPFGMLNLNASASLALAAGSVTSVSGADALVPFGRGSGGLNWLYPLDSTGLNNRVIATPPDKRIALTGPTIDLAEGATVDLSGGGDLYGYEFITGPGGSNDVLDPTSSGYATKYAVIPGVYSISTPYDPSEFSASGLKMGDSVYLNNGAGLAAGWYTLLPAHYALLPGAYLVTPEAGTRDMAPGQSYTRLDGSTVVAGRYGVAGTPAVDPRWQGFAVEPGSIARTRSQYQDYSANQFFADKATRDGTVTPQLPRDAGSLAISADSRLTLGAELAATAAANGVGGQVDIGAARLAVVGTSADLTGLESGTVGLLADDLNQLNVESLLLGGLRSKETTGRRVSVVADSVEIAGNASLTGREILLAGKTQVKLGAGAVVESRGQIDAPADDLLVSNRVESGASGGSDGALVRVSALPQVGVIRDQATTGNGGVLVVESGAKLTAEGSMLLDSTTDTKFAGTIAMAGGSLALKSSKISLGNAPADSAGLVLAKTGFTLDELKLTSATDLNLYGAVGIDTKQLAIDAAAINGYANDGAAATIRADAIFLDNSGGRASSAGTGSGELSLTAKAIALGAGQYAITGFNKVNFSASEALLGQSDAAKNAGRLTVAGDVNLSAGHISGGAGSTTEINATGHSLTLAAQALPAKPADTTGLGVGWTLQADSISGNARFDLPSGLLAMTALRGDVRLDSGFVADVSGQSVNFAALTRYTPAGSIKLAANQGNVVLASGSSLNLSGANIPAAVTDQTSDAGSLAVTAPQGGFDWSGTVTASAVGQSKTGSFALDAASFDTGGLSALNGKLAAAGFAESLALRQRSGDVSLPAGETVRAHRVQLSADSGAVNVAGNIDAAGTQGGEVAIQGSKGITLGAGAAIDAHATGNGERGGKVSLDTVDSALTASGSGRLDLSAASSINVSGGAGGQGGSVHLRTGRDDGTGQIAVTEINTQISGATRPLLEATRVYTGVSTVDDSAILGFQADTAAFMTRVQAPTDHSGAGLIVAPGLDLRSAGNLTLAGAWDFAAKDAKTGDYLWRWQGVPGYLSLNAGGDLDIKATLTDAFATLPDSLYGTLQGFQFQDTLQPGYSWSYALAAGGDVRLASTYTGIDPLNPAQTATRQVMVRTGTGSIDIQAGNDLLFVANPASPKLAAAVYTVGRPADYTFDDLLAGKVLGVTAIQPNEDLAAYLQKQDPAVLADLLRWGTYGAYNAGYGFLAEYPTHGGDIHLAAGGDISGIETGQMMTDWLVRSGTWNNNAADANRRPTAWGVDVSGATADRVTVGFDARGKQIFINEKASRFFNQNVGALGGGDVSVSAGGHVSNLSVMIPTTGKPMGVLTTPRNGSLPDLKPGGATDTQWIANGTEISGGGNLSVSAGGDIRGGEYYTGLGSGRLNAGGGILASDTKLGAVIEQGDASFQLTARRDVVLGTALNPTLLPQHDLPDSATRRNAFFFTYAPDSRLDLASAGGDVVLQNAVDTFKAVKGYTAGDGTGFELAVYPGTLTAQAPAGDIRIDNSLILYPSALGQLELLAGQDIGTDRTQDATLKLNLSDADPALLPQVALPESGLLGDLPRKDIKTRERLDPESSLATAIHATTPVHENDTARAAIIAKGGDIAFPGNVQMKFFMPKATEVQAGRDIKNLSLYAQNLNPGDISRVQAGRDLVFDSRLDANGGVVPMDQRIQLDGPGRLQVLAGRNINLGSSSGILTIGNLFNRALSGDGGAGIDLLAGLSDQVEYAGFIGKYLTVGSDYLAKLKLDGLTGNPTPEDKLAYLKQQPDEAKLSVVQDILFSEIKQSAAAAAKAPENQRGKFYQQGFDAIATLFPGKDYAGDLALVFSQIKTLAGGDINLAVPGGQVDVGLAGKVGGLRKEADELGIVAQQQGNVNAFASGNFNVNQSRVFTMGGDDIAIWSSKGDIDAGKGAKSAISAPPPVTGVDENGNIVTIFPPIVSGSGIQAITPADASKGQGNVYLAAPKGVVNAGEAGISGGQVVIAASAVIGASNIQASGGTVGVPTAVAPPVVPAGAAAAAAGAAKAATQSGGLDDAGKTQDQQAENQAKSMNNSQLSADVVGYGQCSVADVRAGTPGCGG